MADSAVPYSLGPSAQVSGTYRDAAGIKQTRALKPEDASRRRAELEAAVQRKVEFEKKAVHIVEQLLEENITEEFLKECGMFITPAHYSDVVDERSIIKLCGYPLCQKKLGVILKQKYKISTKTNKVYDITERKSFCSNFCYRASKFFETQIPKTPVWVREEERPPDFQLLKEGQSGCSGEVVQFFNDAITAADIDSPGAYEAQCKPLSPSTRSEHTSDDEQGFVSSLLPGNRAQATARKRQPHRESSIERRKAGQKVDSRCREQTVADVTEQLGDCRLGSQEKADKFPSKKEDAQISLPVPPSEGLPTSAVPDGRTGVSEVTLVGISKKSVEHFRTKFAKSNQGSGLASTPVQVCPEVAKANLLRILKDTLTEWKTEETLTFLYGQDRSSVCPKPSLAPVPGEELDEDDVSCGAGSCGPAPSQPQNNLDDTLSVKGSGTAINPVPSYESLKKETKMLNLRVREFYRGRYVLSEEMTKLQDPGENVLRRDPSFPLIDSSSQNQIRKRIVLEKLSKVLTPILGIQKHSRKNVVFTQFIAILLKELHLKCEDLEHLTIIFRTSC
ncbi:Rpap2 [Phodopus roborovskii]|uniref:RNA polymerase II subunit B1 CTD phosphatase RPAP2 homolog n=1 Tax=Phodopus roborovskii TaxID=109678 RepID=A0AAU9ZXL3_PHORO|nr:Rpap2 [Phodopus roborovskii]